MNKSELMGRRTFLCHGHSVDLARECTVSSVVEQARSPGRDYGSQNSYTMTMNNMVN